MGIPTKEEFDEICDVRFSKDIHMSLKKSSVAIAGLGGLGSNIAVMLARSCIGKLLLVDFDTVDISNLNRQIYNVNHIGMNKTEALSSYLKNINPYIEIETVTKKVDDNNVLDIFKGYQYVCEAFDVAENKAMLVNNILCGFDDTIIASGSGMAGYGDSDDITTKKINSRLYVCGDGVTDTNDGVGLFSPRVAICAGHQANKIIQLIINTTKK